MIRELCLSIENQRGPRSGLVPFILGWCSFAVNRPWAGAFEDDVGGSHDDGCCEPHHEDWFWAGNEYVEVEFRWSWPLIIWNFDVRDECAQHGADGENGTNSSECTEEKQHACEDLCEGSDDRSDARHGESGSFNQRLHGHRATDVHDPEHQERSASNDPDDGDVFLSRCFGQCVVHGETNIGRWTSIPV